MSKRRRPFVAVETDVAKDESFAVLGDVCGYNRDEALGRIVRLWAWCADRKLQDAPPDCPGYAVPEGVIVRFLGPDGVRGILGDGVAEFALGERFRDGLIYLLGTDATVAARRSKVDGAAAGGEVRAREILATGSRGDHGRFVTQPTIVQPTHHLSPADSPPRTSVDPRSQIPDPEELSRPARAIPPAVLEPEPADLQVVQERQQPAGGAGATAAERADHPVPERSRQLAIDSAPRGDRSYNPDDPFARGRLAEATYRRVSDARIAEAARLGLPEPLPFPERTPSSRAGSYRDLLDRIREEGGRAPAVCNRVVENLIAQARSKRSIEWLSEKAFSEGGWRTAREGDVPVSRKSARAGPRSQDPTVGRVEPQGPERYARGDVKL